MRRDAKSAVKILLHCDAASQRIYICLDIFFAAGQADRQF